ncbi:hypothetical protein D046_2999B, partial [Vibrio parahaemolyticus V-223/04]
PSGLRCRDIQHVPDTKGNRDHAYVQ